MCVDEFYARVCTCAGACHVCTYDCVLVCLSAGGSVGVDDRLIFLDSSNSWRIVLPDGAQKRPSSDSCCNIVTGLHSDAGLGAAATYVETARIMMAEKNTPYPTSAVLFVNRVFVFFCHIVKSNYRWVINAAFTWLFCVRWTQKFLFLLHICEGKLSPDVSQQQFRRLHWCCSWSSFLSKGLKRAKLWCVSLKYFKL